MNFRQRLLDNLNSDKNKEREKLRKGSNTLIIDMNMIFSIHYSANKAIRQDGVPVGGVSGALNAISKFVSKFNANEVYCIFDGKNSRKRRTEVLNEYKAHRNEGAGIQSSFDLSEEQNNKSKDLQLKMLFHLTKFLPVKVIKFDELEADDIIGYLINKQFSNYDGNRIIISRDKDFYQLINERTVCYDPVANKVVNKRTLKESWNTYPENVVLFRIIEGDVSDNIKGVHGIGTKTLQKFFPELSHIKIGDIDDFIELIESKRKKLQGSKKGKDLLDSFETLRDNFYIMSLRDTLVNQEESIRIQKIVDSDLKNKSTKKRQLINAINKYKLDDTIYSKNLYSLFFKLKN